MTETEFPTASITNQSQAYSAERAILVRVNYREDGWTETAALEELALLCDTAGIDVAGSVTQNLDHPNARSYVGSGKLEELLHLMDEFQATVAIFDDELTPAQMRNIERRLTDNDAIDRKVIDRPTLILDIFAAHAVTHDGRLQVELAQLEYRLPRLTNMWTHLSRQGVGGVGLRGPGETQLEVDRRMAENRIHQIKGQLEQVHRHRELYRTRRRKAEIPVIALVGYTNAGKSTLLNRLTDAGVQQEDKLFATLDPTTRKVRLPSGREALVTDTVGFINNLPPTLIAAFRATLEEIGEAAVLLHVLDVTHPNALEQADTVISILDDLELDEMSVITVLNKIDALDDDQTKRAAFALDDMPPDYVAISAQTGEGTDCLLETIDEAVSATSAYRYLEVLIPYERTDLVNVFYRLGEVDEADYRADGTWLAGHLPQRFVRRFERFAECIEDDTRTAVNR
ncbi:MAG: GTPase HflX [Chloroflexota bacterium]